MKIFHQERVEYIYLPIAAINLLSKIAVGLLPPATSVAFGSTETSRVTTFLLTAPSPHLSNMATLFKVPTNSFSFSKEPIEA